MQATTDTTQYDVIIIGGGITGGGTARDCAMRGLRTLLLERHDIATGATGRNHGLLHSGARYAVTDRESAAECIGENMILRRIARHCVEDTGGLFISLPEDDPDYRDTFIAACGAAGIPAVAIDAAEALRMEPAVNPRITGAVRVPDGSIDPFRLTAANIAAAICHGAVVKTHAEVTALLVGNGRVDGVEIRDTRTGALSRAFAPIVVNAAGIWGHDVALKAGVTINMFPAKGSLLVFGHRVNGMVLNRCRRPADGDILVPGDTVTVLGTTSSHIKYEETDNTRPTPEEVASLIHEGSLLAPRLAQARLLRAYCGVRPLVASDDDPTGRSISRGIVLLDHGARDGLEGFVTITGGKLMTYRLMAERATDLVCRHLGMTARCTTAETPLPGSEDTSSDTAWNDTGLLPDQRRSAHAARGRHGCRAAEIEHSTDSDRAMVCECEQVSAAEIKYAMKRLHVFCLNDLRRRTRMGMGPCQGMMCAIRAAAVMAREGKPAAEALEDLRSFVSERWNGMRPVAWGSALAEAQMTEWIYAGICGL